MRNQEDIDIAIQKVQVLYWIDHTAFHSWRAMLHLNNCADKKKKKALKGKADEQVEVVEG